MSARNGLLVAAAVGLLCAGCASTPPTAELTRARTLIDQAEKSGAQQYAAEQLDSARDKLRLADAAARDGHEDEARARANEAAAAAQLAQAKAETGTAQKAADQVQKSTEALQREADRSQGLPPAQTTPAEPTP